MVQPSYPNTVELPHSSTSNTETPKKTGADVASTDMAPPEGAPEDSHANYSDDGQSERPNTTPVSDGSIIRKEKDAARH